MKKTLLQIRYGYPGLSVTYNEYLAAFDSDQYHKIVLFLLGPDNPQLRREITADEVLFLDLAKKELRGLSIKTVLRVARLCKQRQVDLILAHRYKTLKIVSLLGLIYPGTAIFGVVHRFGQFDTLGRRLLGELFIRRGHKLIGVSGAVRTELLERLSGAEPNDILGLGNCIDIDQMESQLLSRHEARAHLGFAEQEYIVGTIARLSGAKDYPLLLKGFAKASQEIEGAKLVIIGEGPMHSAIEEEVRHLGIEHKVTLTGHIEKAWRFFSSFDLFVLASKSEAFGRVLLEAMVARVMIVATETGGIREVVGGGVELQVPGEAEGMAEAIIKAYSLEAHETRRQTEALYQRASTSFNRSVFAERLLAFINDSLASRTSARQ